MSTIIPGTPHEQQELDVVRVVPTQSFKAAIGGTEIVHFKQGVMHPTGFHRADVAAYIADKRLTAYSVADGVKKDNEIKAKQRAAEAAAAADAQKKALELAAAEAKRLADHYAAEAKKAAEAAADADPNSPAGKAAAEAAKKAKEAAELAGKGNAGGDEKPTLESLLALKKEELLDKAEAMGVEVDEKANKETIAKAILENQGA